VLADHAIAQPSHAARQFLAREETEGRSSFRRRLAWNIEEAGNANTPIHDWNDDMADFIDEPGLEHGTIETSLRPEASACANETRCQACEGPRASRFPSCHKIGKRRQRTGGGPGSRR